MAECEDVDFIENGADDWYTTYEHLGYETTVVKDNEFLDMNEEPNNTQLNVFSEVDCGDRFVAKEVAGVDEEQTDNFISTYGHSEDVTNDLSKHNLVLKEIITDQGLIKESYFCQECAAEYSDINDFLQEHPGIELLNEKPDDDDIEEIIQEQQPLESGGVTINQEPLIIKQEDESLDKLWDLVENTEENDEADNVDDVVEDDVDPIMSDFIRLNKTQEKDQESISDEPSSNTNEPSFSLDAKGDHYFCYECRKLFSDLKSAEEHECGNANINETTTVTNAENDADAEALLQEKDQDDLVCNYCQKLCASFDDLINHMTTCEENGLVPLDVGPETFDCDVCEKRFSNLRSLYNHQRQHRKKDDPPMPPVKCEICNTFFQTPKNLKLHMKMHNERTVKSIQEALPAGALPEYNELNQFYCEICNKSFDQRLLAIHKNMHQNVEEYNCGKCNKQFDNIRDYEMHKQMHIETKGHTSHNNTINHATSSTSLASSDNPGTDTVPNSNKKHACQYCGKEFQRPYEKVKHERVHTGEKPYNCEVCGKSFRVSYSLTLHLRTHTDIRPYVCAICNKRFKQQSVYVHHLKTHESERQYKCEECGKSFRTSVQLCGHRNSHKKPFNCTECNRPFASMYAVKVHMKTHSKNTKASKNLSNRCNLCGASYARIFALRIHMKEQHGIEMDTPNDAETSGLNKKYLDNRGAIIATTGNNMDYINEDDDDDIDMDETELANSNHDADLDETEAATQTIMPKEDIIVDDSQQIILEWLQ
ncbi:optix-binding protein [Musca autumnalis]|uniref:optix-binding protein n=1 Tax=Musca autumnalis TaxID=221902 RepID=UPI003CE67BED